MDCALQCSVFYLLSVCIFYVVFSVVNFNLNFYSVRLTVQTDFRLVTLPVSHQMYWHLLRITVMYQV